MNITIQFNMILIITFMNKNTFLSPHFSFNNSFFRRFGDGMHLGNGASGMNWGGSAWKWVVELVKWVEIIVCIEEMECI